MADVYNCSFLLERQYTCTTPGTYILKSKVSNRKLEYMTMYKVFIYDGNWTVLIRRMEARAPISDMFISLHSPLVSINRYKNNLRPHAMCSTNKFIYFYLIDNFVTFDIKQSPI